jgi:hypothetical protein
MFGNRRIHTVSRHCYRFITSPAWLPGTWLSPRAAEGRERNQLETSERNEHAFGDQVSRSGAGGGNRTRTLLTEPGILSPVRLPVSPPRRRRSVVYAHHLSWHRASRRGRARLRCRRHPRSGRAVPSHHVRERPSCCASVRSAKGATRIGRTGTPAVRRVTLVGARVAHVRPSAPKGPSPSTYGCGIAVAPPRPPVDARGGND